MFRIEALPISLRTLTVCARPALAASFLAAVTDRLGVWGLLLLAFAIGMIAGTGVKSALNASVFCASACAFLLWRCLPTDAGSSGRR
jgi:uncharacterized membrane protein